jgi:hypothetical protein
LRFGEFGLGELEGLELGFYDFGRGLVATHGLGPSTKALRGLGGVLRDERVVLLDVEVRLPAATAS